MAEQTEGSILVDASAAVDLAQSVVGSGIGLEPRCELDNLRRRAIDVDHVVSERDVVQALNLADGMIRALSPT